MLARLAPTTHGYFSSKSHSSSMVRKRRLLFTFKGKARILPRLELLEAMEEVGFDFFKNLDL